MAPPNLPRVTFRENRRSPSTNYENSSFKRIRCRQFRGSADLGDNNNRKPGNYRVPKRAGTTFGSSGKRYVSAIITAITGDDGLFKGITVSAKRNYAGVVVYYVLSSSLDGRSNFISLPTTLRVFFFRYKLAITRVYVRVYDAYGLGKRIRRHGRIFGPAPAETEGVYVDDGLVPSGTIITRVGREIIVTRENVRRSLFSTDRRQWWEKNAVGKYGK